MTKEEILAELQLIDEHLRTVWAQSDPEHGAAATFEQLRYHVKLMLDRLVALITTLQQEV